MNEYEKNVPAGFKPAYYKDKLASYGSIEAWAEDIFTNSIFIDPAKVARVALENAASIAGMFLTTECIICDKPEEKAPAMPMGNPGMGGMM